MVNPPVKVTQQSRLVKTKTYISDQKLLLLLGLINPQYRFPLCVAIAANKRKCTKCVSIATSLAGTFSFDYRQALRYRDNQNLLVTQ